MGKESYHVESDSIEELNRLIAEEEKKIFETYKSQIDTNESGDMNFFGEDNGRILKPEYRYSMNGGASIGDMLIKTPGGNCKIEIDTPTIKEPEIEYKSLLPPVDLLDSYPDACSYMVSRDFTEKDAMKLMGVDQKSRGKYCSDRQKIDNNDHVKKGPDGKTSFDHLNNIASKMANAAEDNMTPKFTITVSRNLYNDNVDNLAEKRGEFMQKYIYKKFLESANPDALPKWGETLEAFKKVFVIEHPYYAEAKSGNFGPEPLAKSAKQPHELEKLEKSLKVRSDKYLNDNKEYSQKEINAKSQIEAIKREISARKSENAKLKIKLEKTTDLKLANDLAEKIKENHAILLQKMHDKKYKEYQIKEFSQMKTYSEKKAKEYDPTTNKNLLKDFYTKRPESPGDLFKKKSELGNKSAKEIWDSKLFNKFKMASVEGTFVGGTKVDADLEIDEFSPKIKYIVDKSFKATGFQCSYKMEEMRKKTTRKKLKWPKGHWWKRALMKPVIGITWAVATPFIGLAAIGRGIGKVFTKKSTCPNFSGRWHPYKKIYRKMNPRGHDGGFKIKTKAKRNSGKKVKGGKYDGYNPDIWPEAEEAFKNK